MASPEDQQSVANESEAELGLKFIISKLFFRKINLFVTHEV